MRFGKVGCAGILQVPYPTNTQPLTTTGFPCLTPKLFDPSTPTLLPLTWDLPTQVRNPELRPVVLEKGGEEVLRAIKDTHPKDCGDVAAAALRDLGLENYGSTMVTDSSYDA